MGYDECGDVRLLVQSSSKRGGVQEESLLGLGASNAALRKRHPPTNVCDTNRRFIIIIQKEDGAAPAGKRHTVPVQGAGR